MMNKFKQNKGITLIALIITIIILLILAGVVINMTVGNNGIISKSQVAVEQYKKEQALEELRIKVAEINMEKKGKATLQDVVDGLNSDTENEYMVSLTQMALISGEIPTVGNATEIYVTYKNYQFKIDSNLVVTFVGNGTIVKTPQIGNITYTLKTSTSIDVTITTKNIEEATYSYELYEGENKIGETINSNNTTQEFTGLTEGTTYKVKVNLIKEGNTVDTKEQTIGMPKIGSITLAQSTVIRSTNATATVTGLNLDNVTYKYQLYKANVAQGEEVTSNEASCEFESLDVGSSYSVKVTIDIGDVTLQKTSSAITIDENTKYYLYRAGMSESEFESVFEYFIQNSNSIHPDAGITFTSGGILLEDCCVRIF